MQLFDELLPASFNDTKFPVSRVAVSGGMRDHVHEFPHSPGGLPEKLGRKLYEIRMTASFHVTFRQYPNLWPDGITALFGYFESGTTYDLVVPTLGRIKAYAVDWNKTQEARARSGESAEFLFREDSSDATLTAKAFVSGSIDQLAANWTKFDVAAEEDSNLGSLGDLVDSLTNAVNSVTSIADQVELQSNLIAANVQKVADLCQQADAALDYFKKPENNAVKEALHNLWYSAFKLNKDVTQATVNPATFTTPTLMPVTTIAKSVFGDSSKSVAIMKLNPFADPFRIPAGTVVRLPKAA